MLNQGKIIEGSDLKQETKFFILHFPFACANLSIYVPRNFTVLESCSALETSFKNTALHLTTGLLPIFPFHSNKVKDLLFKTSEQKMGCYPAWIPSFLHDVFLQMGTTHRCRGPATLSSCLS